MSPDSIPEGFGERLDADRLEVEKRCASLLAELVSSHAGMAESMGYSLLGGGKRLRPILCLWTHDVLNGDQREAALDAACAIECIHAYSLIHDDLPCMDDDDFRRGKPSSHKKFGEATAVLTGDALLTLAFEIVATIPTRRRFNRLDEIVQVTSVLASAAGAGGLIQGQALDLEMTGKRGDLETVRRIHKNKTARLICAAMEVGSIFAGADDRIRDQIRRAGILAGEAFQIIDDVLDLEAAPEVLGKTPGKDALSGKLTYPSIVGVETARAEGAAKIAEAKESLPGGERSVWMRSLLDKLVDRVA